MNLLFTNFIGNFKPFRLPLFNKFEIFNDTIVYIVTFHFMFFTDIVPEPDTQFNIGYSCIFFVSLGLVANMSIIIGNAIRFIKLVSIKYYRLLKWHMQPERNYLARKWFNYKEAKI